MPRATLEILEGRTLDQKKRLAEKICGAIEEFLYLPEIWQKGSFLRIVEIKPEDLATNGELLSDVFARGEKFSGKPEPRLTVQYVDDRIRSMEQRRGFISRLTEAVVDVLGCPKENVLIFLLPEPKDVFAVGGEMRCDVDNRKKPEGK